MGNGDSDLVGAGEQAEALSPPQPRVFINYRHEDTIQGTAWALYMQLEAKFGAECVFFDNGTLRPGARWFEEIRSHAAAAGVFIALVGGGWAETLSAHGRQGGRDYVAIEIELALRNPSAVTVIPVLVDDAPPPSAALLPPSIKALAACQVEHLRHTHLRDDIDQLIRRVIEIAAAHASAGGGGQRGVAAVPGGPIVAGDTVAPDRAETTPSPGVDASVARPEQPPELYRPPTPASHEREDRPASDPQVAPRPDEEHYRAIAEDAGNIVVFLGAGVNAEDGALPDDAALARYLAGKVKQRPPASDLAEVAQYARALKGEPAMFRWLKEGLAGKSESGPVHRYIARLPKRLEQLGLERRYQMIVTPKYDAALERAFRDESEPFDVAVYMRPSGHEPSHFVHIPYREAPVAIDRPTDYRGFPIRADDDELTQTLIVRINGSGINDSTEDPDASYEREDNYVVTEDHYIEYLSGANAEALIPAQILTKLRNSNCLFLGYTMSDWRLRVFLRRVWRSEQLGKSLLWAVEREPVVLERQLCRNLGVTLYSSSLVDYVSGLDRILEKSAEELRE